MFELIALMALGALGASVIGVGGQDDSDVDDEKSEGEGYIKPDESTSGNDSILEIDGYLFSADSIDNGNVILGTGSDDTLGERPEESDSDAQYVFGGEGNDQIRGFTGDVLIGGQGHDTFVIDSDQLVSIIDFSADDTLKIKHDGEPPQLDMMATDDGLSLFANGQQILNLSNVYGLDLSRIVFEKNGS